MSWTGHPKLRLCVDVLIRSMRTWEALVGSNGIETLPDSVFQILASKALCIKCSFIFRDNGYWFTCGQKSYPWPPQHGAPEGCAEASPGKASSSRLHLMLKRFC